MTINAVAPTVIRNDDEHTVALAEFRALVALDPAPDTPESDRLDLLILLIDAYESQRWPHELPDPIAAIEFYMDQQGLTPRDLIPYLGTRSRVSKVLSGHTPLSLAQIRALHEGLGIPADILIRHTNAEPTSGASAEMPIAWDRFPVREMAKRNWLTWDAKRDKAADAVRTWFDGIVGAQHILPVVYCHASSVRGKRTMDAYALAAWSARIMQRAQAMPVPAYESGSLTDDTLTALVRLSARPNGVQLALDYLRALGIVVVLEPHLPRTHLDGAALQPTPDAAPIIGMTLRYDRLDNFWFVMLHELAHIRLHLDGDGNHAGEGEIENAYFDDLDDHTALSAAETAADALARDTLIPPTAWAASEARHSITAYAALTLAEQLGISPAIVAGRMRYEHRAWRMLNNLVGHGEVTAALVAA